MTPLPVRRRRSWGLVLTLTLLAAVAGADELGPTFPPLVLTDVPFLSQPPALCGGAALAMVARYWGAQAVQPEDFETALAPGGKGITPETLEARARALGLQAFALQGEREPIQQHLAKGRPLITLLDAGSRRFHYVVLLGWSRERVIFHDPAEGPFRVADTDEWQRRWSASGNWTLLLLPSERPLQPARSVVAQKTPDPAPSETQSLHERASHEFRRENWGQAAEFAAEIVAREPEDADAWRLLGTSRFLEDRPYEALEAWNAVGEPTIDLVRIDGIERLRPRTLEQYLGLANGRLLTARALRRGERRLALLPAAQAGRLAFRPIPGGRASLEGALLERRAFPTMRGILIDIGVRAATEQALGFDQNMLGPNGETIRALAQWQSHRSRVLLAASAPRALGLPGVVSAQLLHDVQTYQGAAELGIFVNERRRRVSLSIDNWWTADLATSVEIASDDWAGRTRTVSVAERTERRLFADHVAVGGRLQGWWSRDRPFYAAALEIRARTATKRDHPAVLHLRLAHEWASAHAPLAVWPGAGTGTGRDVLLRGHPLLKDGIVEGAAFGRRLLSGGLEGERWLATLGPARVGAALFVDAVRVASTEPGPGARGTYVDVGAGIRLELAGQRSVLRIDVARPGDGSGLQLSAGWQALLW